MNVGLDESGEEIVASRVEDEVVRGRRLLTDGRDSSIANGHRSIHHLHPIVHCQDGGVAEQGGAHVLYPAEAGLYLRRAPSQRIATAATAGSAILPCLTAISSATMLTAIS
jgi:hypothetical protein